jgi:hypothetical protein
MSCHLAISYLSGSALEGVGGVLVTWVNGEGGLLGRLGIYGT